MGQEPNEGNQNQLEEVPEKLDPVRVICSCGYTFIEDDPAKWLECPNCERLNPIREMSKFRREAWIHAAKAKEENKK